MNLDYMAKKEGRERWKEEGRKTMIYARQGTTVGGCTGSFQRRFLVSEKRDNASAAGCLDPSCHLIPRGCLLEDQGRGKEWPH